jgi:hypothetical protein
MLPFVTDGTVFGRWRDNITLRRSFVVQYAIRNATKKNSVKQSSSISQTFIHTYRPSLAEEEAEFALQFGECQFRGAVCGESFMLRNWGGVPSTIRGVPTGNGHSRQPVSCSSTVHQIGPPAVRIA